MEKNRILLIDDDWEMRNLLQIYLRDYYELIEADSGKRAIEIINTQDIDLVILDIMMPELDGWEVCLKIREMNNITPIIMLTALSDTKDKILGLNIGADDYLVKPFEPDELLARVQALFRRVSFLQTNSEIKNQLIIKDLKIDISGREIFVDGLPVEFTPKELELLLFLANSPKQVMTRDVLLDEIWGHYYSLDGRVVDTHVKNIREKLRRSNLSFNPIKTVWGIGYKFNPPGEEI
ncbi:response regulator transcription factor [Fictibacillus aquaticus]|uniref:DNA-binding response regulator n=1 Tax=Fictibacillus aquaticus TaxID=2021314 RepID=A0A235F4Q9_9BACL|nr:response regulator transcription factor [Fictibacillus aquaticus]OYD56198.1 DNA-binding response regulator [Fictibacillus aquaticus]